MISSKRKDLTFKESAMMSPRTVAQMLQVFRLFRDNHASGIPLHKAYHEAVRTVARDHGVTYQTIGDACRRRLGLDEINELYMRLAAWLRGDANPLVDQLKRNSVTRAHADIDRFFSSGESSSMPMEEEASMPSSVDESEAFSFRLPPSEAQKLRALAELEGVSPGELIARDVSAAVRERMIALARRILKNSVGP